MFIYPNLNVKALSLSKAMSRSNISTTLAERTCNITIRPSSMFGFSWHDPSTNANSGNVSSVIIYPIARNAVGSAICLFRLGSPVQNCLAIIVLECRQYYRLFVQTHIAECICSRIDSYWPAY